MFASIELKRRLRALNHQMQARSRVFESDEGLEGQGSRIQGYILRADCCGCWGGGCWWEYDHAVVETGTVGAEGEGNVWLGRGGGVGINRASGDLVFVENEIVGCVEGDDCAVNSRRGGV